MRTQERAEREINLVEIFWSILLGWRRLVCVGILFAILICGMRYFLDTRNYRASQNIDVEFEKNNLKKEENEQISDAVFLQKRIDDYENYQKKSAIMQIDPYAKPVLGLQYYVQSDYTINYTRDNQRDYTPELISMYCNYIGSGEMAQKVIDEVSLPVSQEDFVELVTVSNLRGEDVGSIYLTICYDDEEKLDKISDVIKSLMEQKSSEFQAVGSHKLHLINQSKSVVVDSVLAEKKNTISNNVISLETQLKSLKTSMSSIQLALFDLEVSEMRGESLEEEEVPGFNIKYMILGAMLGIFLVCVWIACKSVFASKLQSTEEMESMYGVRLLGEVDVPGQKKRLLSGIDNLILKLKNKGKKKIEFNQQIKIISANVALSCQQQGIDCIFITGSEYDKVDKKILDKLKAELSAQNLKVQDGGNMLYDVASLQAGVKIGHILLLEQQGVSTYDEISAELDLMKGHQAGIIGVIVMMA